VALDPADGSLWVCERNANQVRRFFRSGTPISSIAVVAPSRIAVDSTTRDAWVSSFDGRNVVHLLASGAPVDTIPLQGPIGIAVDWRRGRIWVADARAGQVVAMRRSGLIEFTVGGLSRVNDVSVDLATGDCWATAPGVSSAARIGADGTLRQWLPGLANPYGVLADSGP
jgi:sugar lactone lactonase YvrE